MGDRFYLQQRAAQGKGGKNGPAKPKRKLKKDVIAEVCKFLNCSPIDGLNKCTIATLEQVQDALEKEMSGLYGFGYESGLKDGQNND